MTRITGAAVVAALAFLLYRATLLPGFDFGDTPSFQIMAGAPVVTPRDGYPLYFAIGRLFVLAIGGDPARALNLASATEAAIACGIIVVVAAQLSGSLAAAIAAAWLFAGSYTFWSQAVIAEVYALHIGLVALTLLLLLRWDRQPTTRRLAAFFIVYAIGFGNHLAMILLAPACALFIAARMGWRAALSRGTLALASACAVAGALQYLWNFHALWLAPLPPRSVTAAFRSFWFDVTKSDWRDTMVFNVPEALALERLRMYAFDVWQQFGWIGPFLAIAGAAQLLRRAPRRAVLLLTIYLTTAIFALTYNVGDTHVFLLPSHLIIALLAAPGIAWAGTVLSSWFPYQSAAARGSSWRPAVGMLVAAVVTVAGAWRVYTDYPALDRSYDSRPQMLLQGLTNGADDRHGLLLTDLNWQIENGLNYFAKRVRPDVLFARMNDVMLYAPILVRDNLAIGRQVIVTERAATTLDVAYGPLFSLIPDPGETAVTVANLTRSLPSGTRYALCVLSPSRELALDRADLTESLRLLTGQHLTSLPGGDYVAIAGLVGDAPLLVRSGSRPFRQQLMLDGLAVTIRMDSWLAFDTIRRMGFGHVIAGRVHTLIVEKGVSFVAFDAAGQPLRTGYASGLFAPPRRFLVQSVLGAPG